MIAQTGSDHEFETSYCGCVQKSAIKSNGYLNRNTAITGRCGCQFEIVTQNILAQRPSSCELALIFPRIFCRAELRKLKTQTPDDTALNTNRSAVPSHIWCFPTETQILFTALISQFTESDNLRLTPNPRASISRKTRMLKW